MEGMLFDMPVDRRGQVAAKRGPISSALMKNIRLRREVDACYWMLAFLRGGIDWKYLGRRCFGSACEDNFSLKAIAMAAELARWPAKMELPYLQSVIASTRGAKWWEPAAKTYTLALCDSLRDGRPWKETPIEEVIQAGKVAIDRQKFTPLFEAMYELEFRKKSGILMKPLLELGADSQMPEAQLLSRVAQENYWYVLTRDWNCAFQLAWTMWHGPLPGAHEPVNLEGADHTIAEAKARWMAEPMEEVPSWSLDGVHVGGEDPRFAGDPHGMRNMIAMYEKYGRLDPDDEGVLLKAGQGGRRWGGQKGMWPVESECKGTVQP